MRQFLLTPILVLTVLFQGSVFHHAVASTSRNQASPDEVFFPEKLKEMDEAIAKAISEKRLPGAVLWLERNGPVYHKAYGNRAVAPEQQPMTEETIFDAASLTKVVATAPAVLLLAERGKINLEDAVAKHIPAFAEHGKTNITIKHLLTHTSGLRPGIPGTPGWQGYEKGIELACAEKAAAAPGEVFRYSDINYILLGEVVRRASGTSLDKFTEENIFEPLKMRHTQFLPAKELLSQIAPTEKQGTNGFLHGIVHDPTSRRMGGVTGHAGLFTSAGDMARFARMLLNGGELDGVRVFKPETVAQMSSVQTPENIASRRGLGWDITSPYAGPRGKHFPLGSYGHTGWTGGSLWIDPFSKTFIVFMSNRNHPDESGSVIRLRNVLGTLAAEAVKDFNFAYVPGALAAASEDAASKNSRKTAEVLNGIDILKRDKYRAVKGLKIGLITNHTGADRERNPTIDLLHKADEVELKALFSPEHGIRGQLDEKVSDGTDEKTGLPIYSLYGERRIPTQEQLKGLDALVFDIQDIGCRFYTYISTMGNSMKAAKEAGIKFIVLDRVNPINGVDIEGPILQGEINFTGWHTIPLRHGMTVGELAQMFNKEKNIGADLQVIKIEGWKRDMYFDQTSLPWINPSPNMRSLTEAVLYPGIGLVEFTAVSVGRGTDTPFEVLGAPYIDEQKLARELNDQELPGVRFVPIRFTPDASVFKGKECRGINIIAVDRSAIQPVKVGIAIALHLQKNYPEQFNLERLNRLLFHPPTMEAIKADRELDAIVASWNAELNDFKNRRSKFLLY